tara:strand:+ start:405 stop:1718 length:1314 start_codon:yes stop_codon:yes gene_type:complete
MSDTRAYPHDLGAERAILGQSLSDPGVLGDVRSVVKAAHFYDPGHRNLFAMLCAMLDDGTPIDTLTVVDRMKRDGGSFRFGGFEYVVELPDSAPSTTNHKHYAAIVRDKFIARTTLEAVSGLRDQCLADSGNVVELVNGVVSSLNAVLELGTVSAGVSIQDASARLLEQQTAVYRGDRSPGLRFGFPGLDRHLSLYPGDVCVLAARPGVGKTALALHVALGWAEEFKAAGEKQVLIFSLEMPATQLAARLCSATHSIPGEAFRQRSMSHQEFSDFTDATNELSPLPMHIFDAAGMTIQEIRSQAAAAHRKCPVGVVVIDYVQLIRNDEKGLNSVERIGEASEGCLAIAKGLGVPVVLLAQINREGGQRKKLSMSDLKGSGKLEEDAVQIVLMSRPGQNNPDEPPERVIIDLAKNRHGATTEQELYFDMQFSRFEVAR